MLCWPSSSSLRRPSSSLSQLSSLPVVQEHHEPPTHALVPFRPLTLPPGFCIPLSHPLAMHCSDDPTMISHLLAACATTLDRVDASRRKKLPFFGSNKKYQ